jgi:hypothetical protein
MFRTLGLKQLCVINRLHQIVGIVTREDLVVTSRLQSQLTNLRLKKTQWYKDGSNVDNNNNNDNSNNNDSYDEEGNPLSSFSYDEESHHPRPTDDRTPTKKLKEVIINAEERGENENDRTPEESDRLFFTNTPQTKIHKDTNDQTHSNSFAFHQTNSSENLLQPQQTYGRNRRFSLNHTIDLRSPPAVQK